MTNISRDVAKSERRNAGHLSLQMPLKNVEEYVIAGAPACEVQRVLPGVGSEGDVLPGAREENPGEGFQEKSSQVPSGQGFFLIVPSFFVKFRNSRNPDRVNSFVSTLLFESNLNSGFREVIPLSSRS